uniref:Coiled-coil domain-containing protein 181 n=1 Tax=Musca domestica TaxID=7370 RepID=A0A1I8N732_MUSDO
MTDIYEHETESDEDCEVYFLKPVNEYNIVDKIKEANKELFAEQIDEGANSNDGNENNLELMALNGSRKVSFAANLEVYEPLSGISLKELENKLGKGQDQEDEQNPVHETENSTPNENLNPKLEIITEEESVTERDVENQENSKESSVCLDHHCENEEMMAPPHVEEVIEEICEEILVMDMENENKIESFNSCESPSTVQRKMLKQITFDYCEEDEQDNKSLTNLLISDNENYDDEEEEGESIDNENTCLAIHEDGNEEDALDFNYNESLLEDSDNEKNLLETQNSLNLHAYKTEVQEDTEKAEYENDEDEDDKLSIIVASYLPDDTFDCDKASLTSSDNKCHHRSRRMPFHKRFSFKRKTKHSNVVGSTSSPYKNNNTTAANRRFQPPPEVTELKLHYKTCCEFKNAQQKLPKYTGYLSEYGLSRDQLLEREQKLRRKQHSMLQETLKTTEEEMRKMHDNERAFTSWLKNKMRFPINKTRNMFDVKRPFGLRKCTSVGGGGTTALTKDMHDNVSIPNAAATHYRSISAKFKKKK